MVSPENRPDKRPREDRGLESLGLPQAAGRLAPGHIITIDGPSGAGKSVVAKELAAHYGVTYLESGAIYRALGLLAIRQGIPFSSDEEVSAHASQLVSLAANLLIEFKLERLASGKLVNHVYAQGEEVTEQIRRQDVTDAASYVAKIQEVRRALVPLQHSLGKDGCVAEGRDMGSVIFPDAPHRFFLNAPLHDRALRRLREELGLHPDAKIPDEQVASRLGFWLATMKARDNRDISRANSPLKIAHGAEIIESTTLPIETVISRVISKVEDKEKSLAK